MINLRKPQTRKWPLANMSKLTKPYFRSTYVSSGHGDTNQPILESHSTFSLRMYSKRTYVRTADRDLGIAQFHMTSQNLSPKIMNKST